MKAKRSTSPPDVATRARVQLLSEVWRGRVRWMVPDGPAILVPAAKRGINRAVDVTRLFLQLARPRPGWAIVDKWDPKHPPASVETRVTPAGEQVLMRAQMHARRRQVKAKIKRRSVEQHARRASVAAVFRLARSVFTGGQ